MSRSKKDGRRGGAHQPKLQNKRFEVWSKRCPRVSMWSKPDPDIKRITHRYERRIAKKEAIYAPE